MTVNQKNAWIALEERYHQNHKAISKDNRSTLLSQMIFCSDGVIIKKFMEMNDQGGITVQNYDVTMEELKANETFNEVKELDLLEVVEYGMEEFGEYVTETVETTMTQATSEEVI